MEPLGRMAGIDTKIERARQLLADLSSQIIQVVQSNPLQVIEGEEPETGDLVFRLVAAPRLPLSWAAITGDIIHNLRSALDHLVWQLVLANHQRPDRQNSFPISENARSFAGNLGRSGRGSSLEARNLIRATRPYRGGNDLLWELHQLDIVDKHRLLMPIGTAHRDLIIDFSGGIQHLTPETIIPPMPLALRPADRQYPLQDGAELFRVKAAARNDYHLTPPQFRFDVAFGEGEVVQGSPLIETLQQFVQLVQQLMEPFRLLIAAH